MGSNTAIKRHVQRYEICYVCETKPPVLMDEFGGHICFECHKCIQNMRVLYALRGGYRRNTPMHGDSEVKS
jgi:translation initiation factor 2 beta subunit (eIF-2beta)/eIF-5